MFICTVESSVVAAWVLYFPDNILDGMDTNLVQVANRVCGCTYTTISIPCLSTDDDRRFLITILPRNYQCGEQWLNMLIHTEGYNPWIHSDTGWRSTIQKRRVVFMILHSYALQWITEAAVSNGRKRWRRRYLKLPWYMTSWPVYLWIVNITSTIWSLLSRCNPSGTRCEIYRHRQILIWALRRI